MKLSEIKKETVFKNLDGFISHPNFNWSVGKNWYLDAIKQAIRIEENSKSAGRLNSREIALLVSILSPANRWERNLIDLENLLNYYFSTRYLYGESPNFTTYSSNVNKALDLLKNRSKFEVLDRWYGSGLKNWIQNNMKAPKTYNFFKNLVDQSNNRYFTIDRHMLKIAGFETKEISKKQYQVIQSIYFDYWETLENLDLSFPQFQAVLWANYVYLKQGILHY